MGQVLFLADVHGNLEALEAILEAVDPEEWDRVICLGDVVGYGPDPGPCIEALQDLNAEVIMGNHDAAATEELSEDRFNEMAREAIRWTRKQLNSEQAEYLRTLPSSLTEDRFECYHGSPRSPLMEYLHGESMARLAAHQMNRDWMFVGHTHIPALYRGSSPDSLRQERISPGSSVPLDPSEHPVILNPGSVGQPRDGDPRAGALVVDFDASTARWLRVEYAIESVQGRMREAGLPTPLIQRLEYGT